MANTTITPSVGAIALAGVAASESLGSMTIVPNTGQAFFNGPAPTLTNITFGLWTVAVLDAMTRLFTWAALANTGITSHGQPVPFGSWGGSYFQATGTFGSGGSVQLEGSNDGVTWVKLSPAALTGAGAFAPLGAAEKPRYLRPNVTAGDGTTAIVVTGTLSFAP